MASASVEENKSDQKVLSLPPGVPGPARGVLNVSFPYLLWDCSTPPPSPRVIVHIKWWGEKGTGRILRVPIVFDKRSHSETSSIIRYPVCCSWKRFKNYFEDMSHLSLRVGLGRSPADMFVIGECVIPHLSSLSIDRPLIRTCSVLTQSGIHLGRLKINFKLTENDKQSSLKKTPLVKPKTNKTQPIRTRSVIEHSHSTNEYGRGVASSSTIDPHKKWEKVTLIPPPSAPPPAPPTTNPVLFPFGKRSKEVVDRLLEQAKTLHQDMINEVNKELVINNCSKDDCISDNEKMFDNNEVEFSELTPPTSPGSTSSFEEYHKVGFLKISREEMDREKEEELVLLEPHPLESRDQELMSHDQLLASHDQEHLQIQTLPSNGLHTHKLKISQSHDRLQSHDQSHDQSRDQPKSGEESTQLYHLLLQIDEGASLFLPSESDTLPNAYLVCKLYCMSVPLTTGIMWRTRQPNFNIRQVVPLILRDNKDLRGQYFIIEVWHHQRMDIPAGELEDELLGLVKISLDVAADALDSVGNNHIDFDTVFPLTIVDSYCPVLCPITATVTGYIQLSLIVGSPAQLPVNLGLSKNKLIPSPQRNESKRQPLVTIYQNEADVVKKSRRKKEEKKRKKEEKEEVKGKGDKIKMEKGREKEAGEEEEREAVESVEFELLISQAHHLPFLLSHDTRSEYLPRPYVTCHPHPSVPKLTTPTSQDSRDPRWEYPCVTHLPRSFLESYGSSRELEFQVWSLPERSHENDSDGLIREADPYSHVFIGRAYIDLSPLLYRLKTLCGWYNIFDLSGDIKGQLKVAITPRGRINFSKDVGGVGGGAGGGSMCSTHWSYVSSSVPLPVSTSCVPLPASSEPFPVSSVPPPVSNAAIFSSILSQAEGKKQDGVEERASLTLLRKHLKSHVEELDNIQESLLFRLKELEQSVLPLASHTITNPTDTINNGGNTSSSTGEGNFTVSDTNRSIGGEEKERGGSEGNAPPSNIVIDLETSKKLKEESKENREEDKDEHNNDTQITASHSMMNTGTPCDITTLLHMSPNSPLPLRTSLTSHALSRTPSPVHSQRSPSPISQSSPSPTHTSQNSPSPLRKSQPSHISPTLHQSSQRSPSPLFISQKSPSPIRLLTTPTQLAASHNPPKTPQESPVSLITPSPTPSPSLQQEEVIKTNSPAKSRGEEEEEKEGVEEEVEEEDEEEEVEEEEEEVEEEEELEEEEEEETEEEEEVEREEVKGIVLNDLLLNEMLQDSCNKDKDLCSSDDDKSTLMGERGAHSLSSSPSIAEERERLTASCIAKNQLNTKERREGDDLNHSFLSSDLEERNEVQRILQTLLKKSLGEDEDDDGEIHSIATDNDDEEFNVTNDSALHNTTLSSNDSTLTSEGINGLCIGNDKPSELVDHDPQRQLFHRRVDRDKLPAYYKPEEELTDRLRHLRLLALSRGSPRKLREEEEEEEEENKLANSQRAGRVLRGLDNKGEERMKGMNYPLITTPERNRLQRVFYNKDK